MKSPLRIILLVALIAIASTVVLYLNRNSKPKCDCYFPNTGKYGVVSQGGKCSEIDCEAPKPKPPTH